MFMLFMFEILIIVFSILCLPYTGALMVLLIIVLMFYSGGFLYNRYQEI